MALSSVRKVLSIAKPHMSVGALWDAADSAALLGDVSLVLILQVGDWARISTPARYYFFMYIATIDQHQDSVQQAVLSLSELSACG